MSKMSIEPPTKKRFAFVDEASMAVLDKKRTPHATRRTKKEVAEHRKGHFEEKCDLNATSKKLARGQDLHGRVAV